ncbi:PIG-L family deacetylase [Dehalococcoidia bacterium]|nr:PIG-L family deacetylase [Dehalococcoidia bacterium]
MIELPQRAMVVFAHPDDEIGCAGTIATWAKGGTEVAFVLCTNGDKGTEDLELTPYLVAQTREREQINAANALGVQDITFLGYPDGELEDTRELRGQLVRELRRFRPEVVLTHAPSHQRRHIHRDHRICGTVTLDAVFPYARDPLHYAHLTKEGFLPHKVGVVLLWGSDTPDEFIDIGSVLETKIQAMLQHRSQFLDRPSRDPNRQPGQFMREGAQRMGEHTGIPFAEGFQKIQFRT